MPGAFQPIVDVVIAGLAAGRTGEALCQAVAATAELVGAVCPPVEAGIAGSDQVLRLID